MRYRYLSLKDFLAIASGVLHTPADELATEGVLDTATSALDLPAASGSSPSTAGHDIYPDLPRKAAAMTAALLRDPPLANEAGHIALGCLNEFLSLNRARFDCDRRVAILKFEEALRQAARLPSVASLIESHVERLPGRRRRDRRTRRDQHGQIVLPGIDREASSEFVFYLAEPFANLSRDERKEIAPLNAAVSRGLSDAAQALGNGVRTRLEHPSHGLRQAGGSTTADRKLWEYVSTVIQEEADALILSDVAEKSAGFGSAVELDLFALQGGPILYLQQRCSGHSRLLRGRRAELDIEVVNYGDPEHVTRLVRRWAVRRAGSIEDAARRRLNRWIRYWPLQRRLNAAWGRSNARVRDVAANAANMKLHSVTRALASVPIMATMPSWRLDALCRELGVERRETPRVRDGERRWRQVSFDALLQAAAERHWSSGVIFRLRDHALQLLDRDEAYAPLLRLRNPEDWAILKDELDV